MGYQMRLGRLLSRSSIFKGLSIFVLSFSSIVPAQTRSTRNATASVQTPSLTLSEYREQVKKGNRSYVGSTSALEGAKLREDEQSLVTKPTLFGSVQYLEDKKETGSPLTGDEMRVRNYILGLRQQTVFGLEGKLTYNHTQTSLPGANTLFVPLPNYYTSGPVLELTQSLGRNGFGSEVRATKDLLGAQVKAAEYSENFKQSQILAQAESAYWRLAIAREAVAATKDTLERAQKIRSLSAEREKLNLGNRSDFLQTDAAYQGRNLELQIALDEEKAASRLFNTMRGLDSDVVSESISFMDESSMMSLRAPVQAVLRDDVKAAEQQKRLAEANATLGIEKNKPDVKVFGAYGLNGRDANSNKALKEGQTDHHPNYTIGLRVDIPLDFVTQNDARNGYRKEARAADLNYQQKVFEQERLLKDLTQQFQDGIKRYQLAQTMEKSQREKLDYERTRHRRGLTTTFQVLQFEQDYANAQLSRLRMQTDVLNIYSQLKTFGGDL